MSGIKDYTYNLSKFRINFVPQDTYVNITQKNGLTYFNLYLKRDVKDDMFDFLQQAVKFIPNVEKDYDEQKGAADQNHIYYYKLETKNGVIRFEINYGGKRNYGKSITVDKKNPPTISLETTPYIPTTEFLKEIKKVVKLLIEKTGFKIYFWDADCFVTVDELYGQEGPTKK